MNSQRVSVRQLAARRTAPAVLVICLASCASAAVSMVVKPPLQSQCQRLPIKGCSELVDGVLLYVEGDKPGALAKIQAAKNANAPAQLKLFAKTLRDTASVPGAEDLAAPMRELADLLDSTTVEVAVTAKPVSMPNASALASAEAGLVVSRSGAVEVIAGRSGGTTKLEVAHQDPATRALSATADFARLATDSVDLSLVEHRTPCKIAGLDAFCIKAKEGAIIITDIMVSRGCVDRVFVGATLNDSAMFGFRWQVETGPSPLTGARLGVAGGEWLQVAVVPGKKPAPVGADCFVTWSGFRPWIVAGAVDHETNPYQL